MATANIGMVECVLASWSWYLNYGIQGCRVEIWPFWAAPRSRSYYDKGHLNIKNGPKRKHNRIQFFVGDKFNGNIIFDIWGHSEVLKDNVITITRTIINCVNCIQMVLTFKTSSSSSSSIIFWQTKSHKELIWDRHQASSAYIPLF